MDYFSHPTSIVDVGAEIGANTKIWHFTHVSAGARIGRDVSMGQNVFVGSDVVVGNHCKIQNNVSLYDGVVIEDGVFCGPSMVFTNVYNPRALVARKNEYRKTLVRRGTTIGANATVVCGVEIGEFAFIAAGAVINKDVKPYSLMAGVPARHIGWMSEFGEQIPLPLEGRGKYVCPHQNFEYELNGQLLSRIK